MTLLIFCSSDSEFTNIQTEPVGVRMLTLTRRAQLTRAYMCPSVNVVCRSDLCLKRRWSMKIRSMMTLSGPTRPSEVSFLAACVCLLSTYATLLCVLSDL